MSWSRIVGVVALAALAACAGERDEAPRGEAPAAAAPEAAAPAAAAGGGSISEAEVRGYRLTMPTLRRWHQGTLAAVRLRAQNPEPETDTDGSTPDLMLAAIEASPANRAALREAGMEPREAAIFTHALVNATMAAALEEAGRPVPEDANPDNVAFVKQNRAELERMRAEREALEEELGPGILEETQDGV